MENCDAPSVRQKSACHKEIASKQTGVCKFIFLLEEASSNETELISLEISNNIC